MASRFPLAFKNPINFPNHCLHRRRKPSKASMTKISTLPEVCRNLIPCYFNPYNLLYSILSAAEIIGADLAERIGRVSVELYSQAAEHALSRGVILADTKFEFGLITSSTGDQQLILIDEVLTPDSSRYWPAASYAPGKGQPSFDKQYLRDWLVEHGFRKGLEDGPEGSEKGTGWVISDEVVRGTSERYAEAMKLLMS